MAKTKSIDLEKTAKRVFRNVSKRIGAKKPQFVATNARFHHQTIRAYSVLLPGISSKISSSTSDEIGILEILVDIETKQIVVGVQYTGRTFFSSYGLNGLKVYEGRNVSIELYYEQEKGYGFAPSPISLFELCIQDMRFNEEKATAKFSGYLFKQIP